MKLEVTLSITQLKSMIQKVKDDEVNKSVYDNKVPTQANLVFIMEKLEGDNCYYMYLGETK
jgi:hypothetical protein